MVDIIKSKYSRDANKIGFKSYKQRMAIVHLYNRKRSLLRG